ncbi:hypothetical protein K505DRAFT_366424 [Melanomma pulvis-pyrius CBS 109.77]|uniref:Uncharacterized protein n=1 Tax=Melanomma pulvis-pyrius CBS 109.77 TaxID=1314802 RepID=A0A6A6WX71_9PLEO|nr:hypothetical protein K505DRAFT_366424 [Melanomma pulvis-pyrius CBS 109.77]
MWGNGALGSQSAKDGASFLSLLFLGRPLLSTPQSKPTSLTLPEHAIDIAQMASYATPRTPYYSAYTGVATKGGEFHHLIRQVDEYHLINGFWRFQTDSDAAIAYSLGFKDPESVLFAEDRGDGPTNTIELRWVPGRSDAYQIPRRGTAKHHLEVILEERIMLGLPASFKYETPVYTVDSLGSLLSYRKNKHSEKIPFTTQSAGQAETSVPAAPQEGSTKVFQHPKRSSTSSAPSESEESAESGSSPSRVASPHGGRTPRLTGSTSGSDDARPVAQGASSNHTAPIQVSTKPTASFHNNSLTLSDISNLPISPAQTYGKIAAHQRRRLPSALCSTDGNSGNSLRTPYFSPYAYKPVQGIPQSPGYSSNAPSSTSAIAQPARSPSFASSDVQLATSGNALNQIKAITSGSSLGTPGISIPYTETFHDSNAFNHLTKTAREATLHEGSVVKYTNTHGVTSEQGKEGSIPVLVPETPIVPALNKEKSLNSYLASFKGNVHSGPQTPAPPLIVPVPKFPAGFGEWLDEMMDAASVTAEPPDKHVEGQDASIIHAPLTNPIAEYPTKLVEGSDTSLDNDELFSFDVLSPANKDRHGSTHHLELPTATGEIPHLHEQSDIIIDGDRALTNLADPLDVSVPMHEMAIDMNCPLLVEPFHCMDCGELERHKFDCNIGTIKHMGKLNIHQVRAIAEEVERADPENWRTHQGPPEPELEDHATKVKGLADIVRHEESYKTDPDLQGLSDDALVILWGLKKLLKFTNLSSSHDGTPIIYDADDVQSDGNGVSGSGNGSAQSGSRLHR